MRLKKEGNNLNIINHNLHNNDYKNEQFINKGLTN